MDKVKALVDIGRLNEIIANLTDTIEQAKLMIESAEESKYRKVIKLLQEEDSLTRINNCILDAFSYLKEGENTPYANTTKQAYNTVKEHICTILDVNPSYVEIIDINFNYCTDAKTICTYDVKFIAHNLFWIITLPDIICMEHDIAVYKQGDCGHIKLDKITSVPNSETLNVVSTYNVKYLAEKYREFTSKYPFNGQADIALFNLVK